MVQAMMIETFTLEEQQENLTKLIEGLTKRIQNQDAKLSKLAKRWI